MKLKVFSQKFVCMVGSPAISPNGKALAMLPKLKNK